MRIITDRAKTALACNYWCSSTTGKRIQKDGVGADGSAVTALMHEFRREPGDEIEPAVDRMLARSGVGRKAIARDQLWYNIFSFLEAGEQRLYFQRSRLRDTLHR